MRLLMECYIHHTIVRFVHYGGESCQGVFFAVSREVLLCRGLRRSENESAEGC